MRFCEALSPYADILATTQCRSFAVTYGPVICLGKTVRGGWGSRFAAGQCIALDAVAVTTPAVNVTKSVRFFRAFLIWLVTQRLEQALRPWEHSLRAGHATSEAAADASECSITNQTGKNVRRYIREGNLFKENRVEARIVI